METTIMIHRDSYTHTSLHRWFRVRELFPSTTIYSQILFLCTLSLTVTRGQAAPILLEEFRHHGFAFHTGPTPASVPFRFGANEGSPDPFRLYFIWEGNYAPNDVGTIFRAPPAVVHGASESIRSPIVGYHSTISEIHFQSFAPVNKPTYIVTDVERIIDDLAITGFQNIQYTVEATQRIRFWGVPVPEPNAFGQFMILIGTFIVIRRQRRAI
jgi:hypothetical protein